MLVESTFAHLNQLGALSNNGRSKTLDASADGYGRGEACIVFVSQPASSSQHAIAYLHGEFQHSGWLVKSRADGLAT